MVVPDERLKTPSLCEIARRTLVWEIRAECCNKAPVIF
jgi:hypothetical protein